MIGLIPTNLSSVGPITAEAKLTALPVIAPAILFQTTLYGAKAGATLKSQ